MQPEYRIFVNPALFSNLDRIKNKLLYPLGVLFTTDIREISKCTAILVTNDYKPNDYDRLLRLELITTAELYAALRLKKYLKY